jgi:hypothetical protein
MPRWLGELDLHYRDTAFWIRKPADDEAMTGASARVTG